MPSTLDNYYASYDMADMRMKAYEVVWKTLGRGLKPSRNQPLKRKELEEREMKLIDDCPLYGQMS